MKRLIVCCDGTWQNLAQKTPTNIAQIAMHAANRSPADGVEQIVYYDSGVGATFDADDSNFLNGIGDAATRFLGGAIGDGVEKKIFDAYRFLACNYVEGDEIFVFGFSRGAFTARSLCGLIYASGLVDRRHLDKIDEAYDLYRDGGVKPDDKAAIEFRKAHGPVRPIRYLGCFDTVGMNGVPDLLDWIALDKVINRSHGFHDLKLNHTIRKARHACAIDEDRNAFPLTRMQPSDRAAADQVQEMWFPGYHGGVGGGESEGRPFADSALLWVADGAREAGLAVNDTLLEATNPKPDAKMIRPKGLRRLGDRKRALTPPYDEVLLHQSVRRRWLKVASWRPDTLKPLSAALDAQAERFRVASGETDPDG